MSELPDGLTSKMAIPTGEDGDLDLELLALGLLFQMEKAPVGEQFHIVGLIDGNEADRNEAVWFQARIEPGAVLSVREDCLGNKFGASLFLALQALAPKRIQARRTIEPINQVQP